jgi:hypothetical protein
MAFPGKLLIFRRPADYPFWACGCARQSALHLTNPNHREGSPWVECPTCEEASRQRTWAAVTFGVLAFVVTLGICFAAWGFL